MTGFIDALSGRFQEFAGDFAGIAPATCLPFLMDGLGKSERVGQLLFEYRVQKFDDEPRRRFFVVVKDDLAVAGIGLNVTHWKVAPD
jgi:hypothetical protein